MPDKKPLSPAIKAIIGEAAGEGPDGMKHIGTVLNVRAFERKLTPDEVALQPKQFSAMQRPDLDQFIAQQPPAIIPQAIEAMRQATQEFQRTHNGPNHYMTADLYDSPKRPSWAKHMIVVDRVGKHVFLKGQ